MTADIFADLATVERDRWGRPLIVPPGGGKAVAYTRCTTYVGALEDTYNLERWKCRMTALGLAVRPDLQLAVVAHKDDKNKLNEVCDQAVEAAQASAAANTGTALHALTEQLDRGELDIATVPSDYRPDVTAYQNVIAAAGVKVEAIEQFGVHDGLKVAGTWDRIFNIDGRRYIADLKTGSIEYGMGKIAMQLAVYSRCQVYDVATKTRTPLDGVDMDRGIVIHLPAGTGKAFLWWVDINAGWEAVALATQVRAWRARKNLATTFEYAAVKPDPPTVDTDPLLARIAVAPDVTSLRLLWADANPHGTWRQVHTEAAAHRKAQLLDATPPLGSSK